MLSTKKKRGSPHDQQEIEHEKESMVSVRAKSIYRIYSVGTHAFQFPYIDSSFKIA